MSLRPRALKRARSPKASPFGLRACRPDPELLLVRAMKLTAIDMLCQAAEHQAHPPLCGAAIEPIAVRGAIAQRRLKCSVYDFFK